MLTAGIRLYEYSRPAEQLHNWFPNSARKTLNKPCSVCARSSSSLFRSIEKNIFSADKSCCLNSARSSVLELETEALDFPEHLTQVSPIILNLKLKSEFHRSSWALDSTKSRARARAEPFPTAYPKLALITQLGEFAAFSPWSTADTPRQR